MVGQKGGDGKINQPGSQGRKPERFLVKQNAWMLIEKVKKVKKHQCGGEQSLYPGQIILCY
jgi:hypothetical protein